MDTTKLQPGHEQHEIYFSKFTGASMVRYVYRAASGQLFSCVAATLEQARRRRDEWLADGGPAKRTLRQEHSARRVATRRSEMKAR